MNSPSFTVNPNVAAVPLAPASGVKVSLSALMAALVTTWFSITSAPSSSRSPALSRAVILTLASASPSMSEKPKSGTENLYVVPSAVVTMLSAAAGASFTAVTSTVMV